MDENGAASCLVQMRRRVSSEAMLRPDPQKRRPATPRLRGWSFAERQPLPYVASKRFDEPWCPQSRPQTPFGYLQSRPQTPFEGALIDEFEQQPFDEVFDRPVTARKELPGLRCSQPVCDVAAPALARAPSAPQLRQQLHNETIARPVTTRNELPSLRRSQSVFDVATSALALAVPQQLRCSASAELATRPRSRPSQRAAARAIPPLPASPMVVPVVVPQGGADKKRHSSERGSATKRRVEAWRLQTDERPDERSKAQEGCTMAAAQPEGGGQASDGTLIGRQSRTRLARFSEPNPNPDPNPNA